MYIAAGQESEISLLSTIATVISIAPIFGLMLALGSPKAAQQFNSWIATSKNSINYIAGGLGVLFALPGLLTGSFRSEEHTPALLAIHAAIVFV